MQGGCRRPPGKGPGLCKDPAPESRLINLENSQQAGAEGGRQTREMMQAGSDPEGHRQGSALTLREVESVARMAGV